MGPSGHTLRPANHMTAMGSSRDQIGSIAMRRSLSPDLPIADKVVRVIKEVADFLSFGNMFGEALAPVRAG